MLFWTCLWLLQPISFLWLCSFFFYHLVVIVARCAMRKQFQWSIISRVCRSLIPFKYMRCRCKCQYKCQRRNCQKDQRHQVQFTGISMAFRKSNSAHAFIDILWAMCKYVSILTGKPILPSVMIVTPLLNIFMTF